ncbi:hypothetical protein NN697_000022 [Staphylococcus pseudintermedius]|nr:hypothetical protein [Staphylococcus pseudintermedius]EJM2429076.1 hypothetical protein [Staphylococcus pseudintermedius]
MISIGGNKRVFDKIIESGIDGIKFSLYAIDKYEMYSTQIDRSERWIEQNHKKLIELIEYVSSRGVYVKINTVVASSDDYKRAYDVMRWATKRKIGIIILNELERNEESLEAIKCFFESLGGELRNIGSIFVAVHPVQYFMMFLKLVK